ncbi:MAG: 4-(cytidine 5'-diphospho)-2-C-methyl-D-erythritol kinase [Arsenophonus endosymbiont of Ceratovacuna japonica]
MISIWPSPAKLNLFLYITGYRSDGYHDIQTLFQFLNYIDEIKIKLRKDNKIRLLTSFINVPEEKNLIIKAAYLLKNYYLKINCINDNKGADIYLNKRLPIGGGLGGGSSNAATTLIALNYLWQMNIDDNTLAILSKTLGADVPIFIYGHSAFAEGIGDKFLLTNPEEKWYLVAYPGINISTKQIFTDPELKRNSVKRSLRLLLQEQYSNDCEPLVRKLFPKIENLISWMLQYTESYLTGTGSCVFSTFKTEVAARKVLNKAPEWIKCFIAKGVNKSPLHKFRDEISEHYHY